MSGGLFTDDSMVRRVHRERVVALSGPRALLMQAAHPLAVTGLLAHSSALDEPYERLKRALRADVDEAEWAKLYSTKSVPFDPPRKGKIAVKVINHYGDEVLRVYPMPK